MFNVSLILFIACNRGWITIQLIRAYFPIINNLLIKLKNLNVMYVFNNNIFEDMNLNFELSKTCLYHF